MAGTGSPYTPSAGDDAVTFRLALLIVTGKAADVALLKLASPAFIAVTEQLPVPDSTCNFPLTIEHAVDEPTSNVTAPVPEPPLVVMVVSGSPNVIDVGPVTDRVA